MSDGTDANEAGMVKCLVTADDFVEAWIGVGAAMDWIALRGKGMSPKEYETRSDEAAEAFVSVLCGLPPDLAEAQVRGLTFDASGVAMENGLRPVPAGIWPCVAATEEEFEVDGRNYLLVLTDDHDEWAAAIRGRSVSYRRLQARTSFILEHWPANTLQIEPVKRAKPFVQANARKLIERLVARTPPELDPLTIEETERLVDDIAPEVPRDFVRKVVKELRKDRKTGPRGPRQPERPSLFEKFRGEMRAAELRN